MTRRSFFTLLATLAAWVSMRPKLRADAINASFKAAKPARKGLIRLWDGLTLVEEREADYVLGYPYFEDAIVVATMPAPGATYLALGRTVFRRSHTAADGEGVIYCHYQYESGPKWLAPAVRPTLIRIWDGNRQIADWTRGPGDDIVEDRPRAGLLKHRLGDQGIEATRFIEEIGRRVPCVARHDESARFEVRDFIYLSGPKWWAPVVWHLKNGSTITFGKQPR